MLLLIALLASAPSPQLTVYFQANLKDPGYQQKAFDRVGKAYRPPRASAFPKPGQKAVVEAVIAADGKLVSTKVSLASGSTAWDAAALAAVKAAAPFPALPKTFTAPSVEAHFHFAVGP